MNTPSHVSSAAFGMGVVLNTAGRAERGWDIYSHVLPGHQADAAALVARVVLR